MVNLKETDCHFGLKRFFVLFVLFLFISTVRRRLHRWHLQSTANPFPKLKLWSSALLLNDLNSQNGRKMPQKIVSNVERVHNAGTVKTRRS
ncbi:hypothetical protein L596_030249 [Steinernema carpocapsae]|uniref:Uncharacterized protein n=1 Tax=Steinernema carpocapsae TaxID=34508 RepID=A0A4U5LS66_STECR|nr:hypothetical protein L596_030249 [Steinernema carpocapsae]